MIRTIALIASQPWIIVMASRVVRGHSPRAIGHQSPEEKFTLDFFALRTSVLPGNMANGGIRAAAGSEIKIIRVELTS